MNGLKGLIRAALRFYAECNNERYVKMLRKKGISVGEDVVFRNPHSTLIDESRPSLVTIGNHVDINVNFQIYTHDWTSFVFLNLYHDFVNSSGKVTIGNNVYIGANVVVLKGVTIGDNCIIGAGSIVNRSIPSGSVAVGNPCRVICTVEEFYERRRRKSLDEAVEYAKSITERYNREPEQSDFWEEFVLFVDKSNIDRYPEIPVRRQLAVGYDDWLRNHKARFGSFDEFLEYVKVQKTK